MGRPCEPDHNTACVKYITQSQFSTAALMHSVTPIDTGQGRVNPVLGEGRAIPVQYHLGVTWCVMHPLWTTYNDDEAHHWQVQVCKEKLLVKAGPLSELSGS